MKKNPLQNKLKFHILRFQGLQRIGFVLSVVCLAAFLCGGCGFREESGSATDAMESTPVVDYAVLQPTPNVLVDLGGYQTNHAKRAAVKGSRIPETFELVDADTKKTVFTGEVERRDYSAEQGLYSGYIDFDEWREAGNYYLECEYIGRSYTFSVGEKTHELLWEELCQGKIKECKEQTVSVRDITMLLLAYEWYADVFADADKNSVPDVMEEIAVWINATKEKYPEPGQEAAYAAALAKFSYLYQKYDRQYATECLKRASAVMEQTQNLRQKDAESFHALTELYRATGLAAYENQIVEYRTYLENHSNFAGDRGYLYGAMTYLATRHPVDVGLCDFFIKRVMEEGESISNLYQEMIHPVNAHNNGPSDLLGHAFELACANYVMNNYQYNHVMEELLHYLRGRNMQSLDYYAMQGNEEYLIMLAQLVAVRENLEK